MNEQTHACGLDPADWSSARAQGHRMLDDMFDYLEHIRARPVWQPIPDAVRARFHAPVPHAPMDLAAVHEEFMHNVLPFAVGNAHRYGHGMKIAPRATLDDGLLDLCLVGAMNKFKLLACVPAARRGLAGGAIFTGVGLGIAASGTLVPLLLRIGLAEISQSMARRVRLETA